MVPYVQFNEVGLGAIARKASCEDIIKFLELVFFVIIQCPQKEIYIRRIMELDERSQYCLMLFIKKALGEGRDDLIEDTELNKKEIEILRNEKLRLSEQLLEIQQELNNEDMRLSIIDLQSELSKSPTKLDSDTDIYRRLEKKLAEKTQMLEQSQDMLREAKSKYEKDITQMRDELDIAHSKSYQITQAEKALEAYKKKVEKMTAMKKRLIDLKRNNEHMHQLIIEHQYEIETYQQYKKSSIFYKEEYNKEKEKYDNLLVALELKEKQITKLNKIVLEMSDKILYQENRIHELEIPLDASFASEDSFNYGKIESENDFRRNSRVLQGLLVQNSNSGQSEVISKELNHFKSLLVTKKADLNRLKETVRMQQEELLSKNHYNSELISQLSSRNQAMANKLQVLSENISNCENDKENHKQLLYELKSIQNCKDSLLSEIKNLYEEKDMVYKKYVSGREEVIILNNKLHEKEFYIRDLQLNLQLASERVKALTESDTAQKNLLNNEENLLKLEKENKELSMNNYELKLRLEEKDRRIEDILKDKYETVKILKTEQDEDINRLKHESDWKSEQMIRQTEEALSQIQKEKDELQARLTIEKKSTLLEWKRAMLLNDPSLLFSEEANKMKLQIAELQKENEKLLRTNQELTICWKDSARMLKSVSKSVGIETKRMQKIMKQKQ